MLVTDRSKVIERKLVPTDRGSTRINNPLKIIVLPWIDNHSRAIVELAEN